MGDWDEHNKENYSSTANRHRESQDSHKFSEKRAPLAELKHDSQLSLKIDEFESENLILQRKSVEEEKRKPESLANDLFKAMGYMEEGDMKKIQASLKKLLLAEREQE